MQSVPITTKVVSLNPSHGDVYSIQHYVIKKNSVTFSGRSVVFSRYSTNKIGRHDINEILLKVVLNAYNPNPYYLNHTDINNIKNNETHTNSNIWTGNKCKIKKQQS